MVEPYPLAGPSVDGLEVLDEVPNTSSIGSSLSDYTVLRGIRAVPLSTFEIGPKFFYATNDFKRSEALARGVEVSGALKPLIVVVDSKGPYILEGTHRLYALHLLGKTAFPALVVVDHEDGYELEVEEVVERLLSEGRDDLVVVDVQPAMVKDFSEPYVEAVVAKINETPGRVLAYYVGRELGYPDDAGLVLEYYLEHGLRPAKVDDLELVEKTYGWFREALEALGGAELGELAADLARALETGEWGENGLYQPDESVLSTLPRYAGATLIGGQDGSCIDEIELLGLALNLGLRRDHSLVY